MRLERSHEASTPSSRARPNGGGRAQETAQGHFARCRRRIASGREDASQVLDPNRFSQPKVRHGYWIATQIPPLLNKLYCWCGCGDRGEHRSALQCFEDKMATDCPVCLGTAEIAYDMSRKGINDPAKIQAAVDVVWGSKR